MNKFADVLDTIAGGYGKALDFAHSQIEARRESNRGPPESAKSTATEGGVKGSIVSIDGKRYVKADRQVLTGSNPVEWSEQLENYINGKIRKHENVSLIAEDGEVLLLTSKSAGKLSSIYDNTGRTMSDEVFERKANAAAHIDELVEVSKRKGSEKADIDGRHGDLASRGWQYRTAYFADFDGSYYKATISAAKSDSGLMVYNIGQMKKEAFPKIKGSFVTSDNGPRENASKESISTSRKNVNRKIKGSAVARDSEGRITNSELAEEINSAGLVLTSRENNKNNVRINAWIKEHHPELHGLVSFKNDNSTGKVTVIDISTREEVEDIRNKENERYQRKLAEERFFNRVKTISGNNALYESMKNHILKGGYSERGVEIHRSRSVVGSNSFYIEDAERDITIKISDHNTIGQQMSYQNTAFIDLHNYASMQEVWNKVADILDDGISDSSEKSTATEGGVKGSYIGKRADGIEVYETSEETMSMTRKERQKKFLSIMENEYRGRTAKFIRNGHDYYARFESKDINKNIYGDKRSAKNGLKAKINEGADASLFELVENAKYDGSKKEIGKNTVAHRNVNYWDYFVKTVQINGRVYDLTANVRIRDDGEYVYSLELQENRSTPIQAALNISVKTDRSASKNSIPASSEKSNRKIKGSAVARDSEGRSLSKEQVEYFKDSNADNINPTKNPDIRFSAVGTEALETLEEQNDALPTARSKRGGRAIAGRLRAQKTPPRRAV